MTDTPTESVQGQSVEGAIPRRWGIDREPSRPAWGMARRISVRLLFIYLILYNFPQPLAWIPNGYALVQRYEAFWHELVPWVGKHLLRLPVDITVFPNGSGDTTFNYVQVLCFAVLAGLATLLWSVVSFLRARSKRSAGASLKHGIEPVLFEALRVYVRYVLALTMLGYGAAKLTCGQFPSPSLERLLEPYGESSPMGLLWTFMGASAPYTIFGGACEALGGLLLLVRRTATLGALVSIGVLTNIVALNLCYDVPVKLYSAHLLLMAVTVASPDLSRLADVLIRNRSAPRRIVRFRPRWLNAVVLSLELIVGASIAVEFAVRVDRGWAQQDRYSEKSSMSSMHGAYRVESFTRDGKAVAPLTTAPGCWNRFIIGRMGRASIHLTNGEKIYLLSAIDASARRIVLSPAKDAPPISTLTYGEVEHGTVVLSGEWRGTPIAAVLRRIDENDYLLINRGFRWINEYPYNR